MKTHYLALTFGIILVLLIAMTFLTFGFGAYMVFNHPNSYVVAKTTDLGNGSAFLSVQATGLQNNSRRIIWIDPNFAPGNYTFVYPASGFPVANLTTDSSGNLEDTVFLNASLLAKIDADQAHPHSVWVLGVSPRVITSPATSLLNTTADTAVNYTASTMGNPDTTNFFWVSLFGVVSPVNANLGELFIAAWTIYLILFAVALNGPFKTIAAALKDLRARGLDAVLENSALATFMVFPVALWGSALLALLQQSAGIPTGSLPPADPLLQFVELTLAPLREEIGFRVIPIGVIALLLLFSKKRIEDGLLALWHPSRYLKRADSP